jgi:cytochrome c5
MTLRGYLATGVLILIAGSTLIARQQAVEHAATPVSPAVQSRFPTGPGRDALFKVCNNCHGPESVLGQLKTREEWSKTLDEMASNGAQLRQWTQIRLPDKHC